MSIDMKPRNRSNSSFWSYSDGNILFGLFLGLVIGVLCAAGVVWFIFKTPPPFSNKIQPASAPAQPPASPQQPGVATAPMALPGKPGDPIPQNGDKPRFDFYKILPGNTEAIPEPKTDDPKQADPKAKAEGALKEPIFLQTGSFQNASDADNQKAKLALMGAEALVLQVMLQDKIWYRVRIGPFKRLDEVNTMRSDLAKQGIEANVVK